MLNQNSYRIQYQCIFFPKSFFCINCNSFVKGRNENGQYSNSTNSIFYGFTQRNIILI